jgi:Fic-DOC domain mobile mystery protein B
MTEPNFTNQPEGATPINDASGLLQPNVLTLPQLNEAEALNIVAAVEWIERGRIGNVFGIEFYLELHRRMLNDVWGWAGSPRTSDTNIGVPYQTLRMRLREAALDFQTQWELGSAPFIEFVATYHHRLVWIHPFQNGNGRWSRLACDAVAIRLQNSGQPIIWVSGGDLVKASSERDEYIAALHAADNHDHGPLNEYLRARNPGR